MLTLTMMRMVLMIIVKMSMILLMLMLIMMMIVSVVIVCIQIKRVCLLMLKLIISKMKLSIAATRTATDAVHIMETIATLKKGWIAVAITAIIYFWRIIQMVSYAAVAAITIHIMLMTIVVTNIIWNTQVVYGTNCGVSCSIMSAVLKNLVRW